MRKQWVWVSSLVLPGLVVALSYGAFVTALLRSRDGDISRFVVAGGPGVDPKGVPAGLTVRPELGGYDGVMFYRLALDPLTRRQTDYGITLDNPPYRQQRIGYSVLVWALCGGKPRLVPAALVVINGVALVAIAVIGGALSLHFGHAAMWGCLFALYPGFLLTLSRDTSEIVACAFMLAAALALCRERFVAAALLLSYAVLTRETALVIAFALAAAFAWGRIRHRAPRVRAITFLLPGIVYAAWQMTLAARWGTLPLKAGAPDFTIPFVEYARFLAAAAPRRIYLQRLYFAESVYLAALVITIVLVWRRSAAPMEWRLAWIGYFAIAATLPHSVWLEDFGFLRILGDFFTISAILIISSSRSARWVTLIMTAGLWQHLARHVVDLR